VRRTAHEFPCRGDELLRRHALEQTGERERDAFQPDPRDRRLITAEQGGKLVTLADRRVLGHVSAQRVEEEVELYIARLLTPQRAVVVEVGDPICDRHLLSRRQERL
jgi:hypothetical protein